MHCALFLGAEVYYTWCSGRRAECIVQLAVCSMQCALFLVAGVGSKARGEPVSGCQSLSSSHLQVRFSHLQARLGGVLDFEESSAQQLVSLAPAAP